MNTYLIAVEYADDDREVMELEADTEAQALDYATRIAACVGEVTGMETIDDTRAVDGFASDDSLASL